jgi:hypothetical protein
MNFCVLLMKFSEAKSNVNGRMICFRLWLVSESFVASFLVCGAIDYT